MRRPFYKLALQKICDCWKGARSLVMLMMQRRSLKRVVMWRDSTPTQTLAHYVNACTLHCAPHDQVESLRNTVKLGRASEWRKSDIGSCQNIKYSHSLTHFLLLELKRNTSNWRARRQTKGVAKRVQGFAQRDFSSCSLLSTAAGTWSDGGLFITIEAVLHFGQYLSGCVWCIQRGLYIYTLFCFDRNSYKRDRDFIHNLFSSFKIVSFSANFRRESERNGIMRVSVLQ